MAASTQSSPYDAFGALTALSNALASDETTGNRVKGLLEQAFELAEATEVILRVPDPDTGGLKRIATVGIDAEGPVPSEVIDLHSNRAGLAFSQGAPLVAGDFFDASIGIAPAFEARARLRGVRSAAYIPLMAGTRVDGVITVLSKRIDHFDSRRVNVLGAYAAAIAVLLEADRAVTQERTRSEELEAVFGFSGGISAPGTFTQRIQVGLDRLREFLNLSGLVLRVPDTERKVLRFVAASGPGGQGARGTPEQPIDSGAMGRAFASGTRQLAGDYAEDPEAFPGADAYVNHLSMLALPMFAHNETIAVLAVTDRQGRMTPDRVRLITAISTGLGQLVEGARLSAELNVSRIGEARTAAMQEERTRISQELHDGLAQMLAYVILKTQATLDHLDSDDRVSAQSELGEIMLAGRSLLAEVRRSITDLRDEPLELVPVSRLLEAAAMTHTRLGGPPVTIRVGKNPKKVDLSAEVATELQAAIGEALANTRNHARATRLSLSVSRRGGSLTIRVADDGVGFDTMADSSPSTGVGTGIMRERMESIHGGVSIESSPGNGTVVRFRVPVERL